MNDYLKNHYKLHNKSKYNQHHIFLLIYYKYLYDQRLILLMIQKNLDEFHNLWH